MAGKPKHNCSGTKIYMIWNSMKQRCLNKNDKSYHNYGGRGITVCEEWLKFENFHNWVLQSNYKEGLEIDRINNDGNYEPSNCTFIKCTENLAVGKRHDYKNTSGYVGVSWIKSRRKWKSQIKINYKTYNLGDFKNITDAVTARINAEIKYFGKQLTNLGV